MSAFGPTPIPPTPGAIQASFIAQQGTGARPRDKARPQDADGRSGAARGIVRDEVRLSDPAEAQAVDSKPDAAEEWKHQRGGQQRHRDPRFQAAAPRRDGDDNGEHTLDLKA